MIGIGISQYEPSGLRDWVEILVGIAGSKNPIADPQKNDCHWSFERMFWRSYYQFCYSITQIIKTTRRKALVLVLALLKF